MSPYSFIIFSFKLLYKYGVHLPLSYMRHFINFTTHAYKLHKMHKCYDSTSLLYFP